MGFVSLLRSFLLAALLLPGAGAVAQERFGPDGPTPYSDAALVAEVRSARPGTTFDVALRIALDPGWHVYWVNPGDSGMPTRITWTLPEGVEAGPIRWPVPTRIAVPPFETYGYYDEVLLLTAITVDPSFAGRTLELRARADWLVCEDVCLPAEAEVALALPVADAPPEPDPTWGPRIAATRDALPVPLPTGWTAVAERTEAGFRLRVAPPPAWAGQPAGAHFFPDRPSVVRHAAEQRVSTDAEGFTLDLERSEFARGEPERLSGLLVAPEGTTWDGHASAFALDLPLAGAALAAADAPTGAAGPPLTLLVALGLAFVGGLLLNLMPCVFPILSIKILGFAEGRGHDRWAMRRHGFLFGAGVLVSFWVLAAGLMALRAGGESLGWGFQLQSPPVVAGLALLMFALGLVLLGVFEIGLGLARAGAALDRGRGTSGAFFSGVLATVVATPCTAPFMGAALGWALAQPASAALTVFTALGLGMALPYVTLASFPGWLERLPKPGPWMVTLRQVLAFGLFATAVWLVWVFGVQTGPDGVALLLAAFTLVGFAGWLLGRWKAATTGPRTRLVTRGLALGALALAIAAVTAGSRVPPPAGGTSANGAWQPFAPEVVEAHLEAGHPVFIDFTAAWCLSCQVNKRVALTAPEVERAFEARGVQRLRADWTHRDPVITEALAAFGRSGVPLYVLYPGPGLEPVVLPEILTPGLVLSALDRIPHSTASLTP